MAINEVAALVLHAFSLLLRDVDPGAADAADLMTMSTRGRRWTGETSIDLGPLHAGLKEQLRETPNRLDERRDAIHQTLAVFRSNGVEPGPRAR